MAGELESVLRTMMEAIDRNDAEGALLAGTEDMQGIDEISRRWMRGRFEVSEYLGQLVKTVSDVRSEIKDVHEVIWGDAGILTCWLEQDYTMDGTRRHISAPSAVVLRREGGEWRAVLFHSVPLSEEVAS